MTPIRLSPDNGWPVLFATSGDQHDRVLANHRPGEAEEDYVPVTPSPYLGRQAMSGFRPGRV